MRKMFIELKPTQNEVTAFSFFLSNEFPVMGEVLSKAG